jgi:phage-related protein
MNAPPHFRSAFSTNRRVPARRSRVCTLVCGLILLSLAAIAELPLHAFQRGRAGGGFHRGPAWSRGAGPRPGAGSAAQRQHLPQWFRDHENMSLQEQQRALRAEPGFDRLPAAEQQRLYQRLQQLDAMPPERRARTLARMEALERMSPEQRQRVRSAMQQVTAMPPDRQRMMRKAFRDLSELPPAERNAMLKSSALRQQFSDQERQTLGILLTMQPYQPRTPVADGSPKAP